MSLKVPEVEKFYKLPDSTTQYVFEDDIPVGIYSDLTINLSELLN